MYLYHLTLQAATNITTSITGSFSAPRTHEILVARGRVLELLQLNNGKLQSLAVLDVFGVIRSILPFRLTGSNQDYIVIASDSGKISVVEFDKDKKRFKKVHEETFGRSGCRRIVPGQFLAADPRGRAVMIGAIEKQKFVYILNRDNAARLTISSPLEAHKSHNLTFDIIGVDVGFDNPVFASIEVDYTEAEDAEDKLSAEQIPKSLTFYELDLGLNHVVRKWSDRIDPSANMLIPVPGGSDGPGGVLVCAENFVYWKNQGKDDVVAPLPRRSDMDPEKGLLVVNYTMHKRKADSFFLIQTELGDLYKLTLRYTDHVVDLIDIKYFDTVPLASSISLLRLGFLFVAAEAGNHMLYQFQSTGDDDQDNDDAQKKAKKLTDDGQEDEEEEEEITFAEFSPRPLKHLELVDQLESNSPIVDMLAKDIAAEGSPQLFLTSGTNSSSAVKVLRYGLRVSQVASADLPRRATAVWTVKKSLSEEFDNYIVVSFQDETLVLSIGDTVSEVDEAECGFSKASATLDVRQVGEDCLLQVLPTSLRLIRSGNRTVEWKTPSRRAITHSAINQRQVLISTEANELFYFKIDASSQLIEVDKKQFEFQISSLDVEPVSIDRSFSRFAAIGDGDDHKVRVISLDPSDCLQTLSIQSVPSLPSSICLLRMRDETNENQLYLHIGLSDGLLIRSRLHQITGEVSDARRRLLGVRAVKLHRVVINEAPAILALSSRSWLIYNYQQRFNLTPLSTSYLDFACSFTSDQCPEGIVSVTESTLRILSIEGLGSIFNSFQIPLKNTPRKIAHIPDTDLIVTIETDHNQVLNPSQPPPEDWEAEQRVTPTKQGPRKWASLVRLYDLSTNETTDIFELGNNDAAFTLAVCQFADRQQYQIVVGASRNLQLKPRAHDGGALYVFSVQQEEGGGPYKLKLDSKNDTEEIPGAVLPFEGKLLVGAGPSLRLYEMGKRKLLKKAEKKGFPSMIKHLHIHGDRIVVGDLSQSFFFVKYKKFENKFYVFADDVFPRWITSACHVDYDTVAGGDKFGNFFVCRLPKEASNEVEEDPTGSHLRLVSQAPSYGCTHKLQQIVQFHVGEPLTALQRLSLVPGGSEVILYTTIFGGIGMFVPFISREDVDFFQHLEASTRKHQPPLCGRDHQAFRSSYSPVKNVVDGDLCEQYLQLDFPAREEIAGELDRSINEVLKKLEDIRNRCL